MRQDSAETDRADKGFDPRSWSLQLEAVCFLHSELIVEQEGQAP
jgi:hypothetical protein